MEENLRKPPVITVKQDYDDFFRRLVIGWCVLHEGPFHHKEIVITAGPWRSVAVSLDSRGDVLHMDFYSALRTGFGDLSEDERQEIIRRL